MSEINVVTGAFGFSGHSITRRLLAMGKQVRTLTNHPKENEFGGQVQVYPLDFNNIEQLTESLSGATTLYNTYWIRFEHEGTTFDNAIENSRNLIRAAENAGVKRIVHISIANPSEDSELPYYRGKALVEKAIRESSLSYTILRPTVLFGDQGILINNIAWFLRHLPVFGIPGDGKYMIQPIFVEDLADLAVDAGQKDDNVVLDAVGPEKYRFIDIVKLIGTSISSKTLVVNMPPKLALLATGAIGRMVKDVVMTQDEVKGLTANLLVSHNPPTATTSFARWLEDNSDWLGREYFSELKKHY